MPIRLLNTRTLDFKVFNAENFRNVPKYAILSHVWDAYDEASALANFVASFHGRMKGRGAQNRCFQKIISFCRQAAADGFEYVWADTCCIDKESEGELREAINSMFRWYKESAACYVYLADVPAGDAVQRTGSAFQTSRWFTRGWTLQELIAPRALVFYNRDWKPIGNKSALKNIISNITGIDEHVLVSGDVSGVSVSTKLSWAAKRKTTVTEDQAYCLLGIFDIFMPLIYGEREKAFSRLLEQIACQYSDQTLFSWVGDGRPSGMLPSLLAQPVPAMDAPSVMPAMRNPVFEIGNRGVQIRLPLMALPLRNTYAMVLNCFPPTDSSRAPDSMLVQFVYRIHDDHDEYVRVFNDQVATFPMQLMKAHPSLLKATDMAIHPPPARNFAMNNTVTFCLKNYPSVSARPGPTVLGPSNMVGHFSAMQQRPGQPHIITMQLDDQMPSTIMLFKNDAGQQIAVCLTVWGDKIKVGLSADCANADLSQIADAFLFGKIPMTFKQPGNFATQATPRRGKKVTLSLSEPTRNASMGTVCDVNLAADKGFWLHAIGPGVLPGCWTRYFDSLARAKPVKQRTGFFGRKTVPGRAQVAM